MKKMVLLGIILLNSLTLFAQHLDIRKQKSLLYINHSVAPKETLYSLGRIYHLSPKVIASANKLKADAGLQTGQSIKIPLKPENFIQGKLKSKKDVEPVYHTIEKGDNLFKLSKNYNRVPETLLKKWNNLHNNTVKPGQRVIVGYVKFSEQKEWVATAPVKTGTKPQENTPVKKVEPVVRASPKINEPVQPIAETVNATPIPEQIKTGVPKVGQSQETVTENSPGVTDIGSEGYFAANYSIKAATSQEKLLSGTAATFKSTSGWSDKKYYVLINDIAPETIVKITANGKSIFAKVLENLPDLKDNKGLVCRLSNAAASALGITDAKFAVEISFYE
jgi:LysM repeat protein